MNNFLFLRLPFHLTLVRVGGRQMGGEKKMKNVSKDEKVPFELKMFEIRLERTAVPLLLRQSCS